ncbi:MAG: acetyl-CoA carboxylase biotin carboxyl carrier protein [Brevinematia bacterium]
MGKENNIPLKEIEEIAKIFKENNLEEISIETEEFSIKLSKEIKQPNLIPTHISTISQNTSQIHQTTLQTKPQQTQQTKPPSRDEFEDETKYHKVKSPITGTFYRAPAPGAEPFVKEGDHVNSGQTLCIVEAMKVMNEIKASVSGKVIKIYKNNAEVVKADDLLMIIEMV